MPPTYISILENAGLGSLADWARQQIVENRSEDEIMLRLYDQPVFQQRFAGLFERRKKGLPAISPAEYIAYENQARALFRAAGFPPGYYDSPDDFVKYIANDKSLAELSQQVALYQKAAYDVPAETRQQLRDLYGVDEGGIAAYFATPEADLPRLITALESSQIAGQAQRQQFGQLSQAEAERLRALGVTEQSASQGFAAVSQAGELFRALPGEQGSAPGRDVALGLVSGDAQAQQVVDLQARRRKSGFQGGGAFAETQAGTTGLGSAAK